MSATCVVRYSPRVTAPSRPSRAASRPVTRARAPVRSRATRAMLEPPSASPKAVLKKMRSGVGSTLVRTATPVIQPAITTRPAAATRQPPAMAAERMLLAMGDSGVSRGSGEPAGPAPGEPAVPLPGCGEPGCGEPGCGGPLPATVPEILRRDRRRAPSPAPATCRVGSTLKPMPPGQAPRRGRPAGAGAHDAEQASWHDPVSSSPQGGDSALARASEAPLREEQTPAGHLRGAERANLGAGLRDPRRGRSGLSGLTQELTRSRGRISLVLV
jgi:hypothetical protein